LNRIYSLESPFFFLSGYQEVKNKNKNKVKMIMKEREGKGKKELIIFICLRLVSTFRVFFGQATGVHII
jgi:hypothetical protein